MKEIFGNTAKASLIPVVSGAVVSIFVVLLISFFASGMSYYNREVSLRSQHEAQEDANRVIFDKFQKTVVEKAGVVKASVAAQRELFEVIMSSKSDASGTLVNFVHQHNPNPDAALTETSRQFRDIMNSIEGLREEFARNQIRSRDIQREHDVLLRGFLSRMMLGMFGANTTPLETKIVTSTNTEEVFESGIDDNPLDPFGENERK